PQGESTGRPAVRRTDRARLCVCIPRQYNHRSVFAGAGADRVSNAADVRHSVGNAAIWSDDDAVSWPADILDSACLSDTADGAADPAVQLDADLWHSGIRHDATVRDLHAIHRRGKQPLWHLALWRDELLRPADGPADTGDQLFHGHRDEHA